MNDQISTLLKDQLTGVDIPQPDVSGALRAAHQKRSRRSIRRGLVAAAVVGMTATGIATLPGVLTTDDPRFSAAAAAAAYQSSGAYAIGSTLYFGNTQQYAVELGNPIRTVNYVDGGVVASTGEDAFTDGAGGSTFWMVTTAGDVTELDLNPGPEGIRFVTTEVGSSNIAYAAIGSDYEGQIVVHDAAANTEVFRSEVMKFAGSGGPNLSEISGDVVYVDAPNGSDVLAVNWRDGSVAPAQVLSNAFVGSINGGRAALDSSLGLDGAVLDLATGEDLLSVPAPAGEGFVDVLLSLDGRYAVLNGSEQATDPTGDFSVGAKSTGTVVEIDTGREATVDMGFSWTPDGNLLYQLKDGIKICEPLTGVCDTEPLPSGANPKVGS